MTDAMLINVLLTIGLTFGSADGRAAAEAVFVGRTPCGAEVRRFLAIPANAPCDFTAWSLALSTQPKAQFKLDAIYGVGVPNQPGFEGGGTAAQLTGTWIAKKDGDGATADVYQLTANGRRMEFRTLGDNLLHPMNSRGTLMVGNAGWSYTLTAAPLSSAARPRRSLEPVAGPLPALAGVFEGRTPCAALAPRLAIDAKSGCTKLKWRLTLHQDPVTRTPTRYVLEGTAFRQAARTGQWSVVRSSSDPARLIYRLDSDGPTAFLSLARADEHILLFMDEDGELLPGDSYFSYTLNRVTRERAGADPSAVRWIR